MFGSNLFLHRLMNHDGVIGLCRRTSTLLEYIEIKFPQWYTNVISLT